MTKYCDELEANSIDTSQWSKEQCNLTQHVILEGISRKEIKCTQRKMDGIIGTGDKTNVNK